MHIPCIPMISWNLLLLNHCWSTWAPGDFSLPAEWHDNCHREHGHLKPRAASRFWETMDGWRAQKSQPAVKAAAPQKKTFAGKTWSGKIDPSHHFPKVTSWWGWSRLEVPHGTPMVTAAPPRPSTTATRIVWESTNTPSSWPKYGQWRGEETSGIPGGIFHIFLYVLP